MSAGDSSAPEIMVGLTGLPVTTETSMAPDVTNQNAGYDDDVLLGEFLARPRFIGSFTWAAASAYDAVLYSNSILSVLLANSDLMLKLRGYAGFKADLNVRIQCAGSPYFTGGLAVGWRPTGGGSINAQARSDVPTLHPAQLLQLPAHALLDPATRDNIELKLPFIHMNGVYDLASPVAYDYLKFAVLNVLRTTGTETATMVVSIHAWMTNVTLSYPTYQSERSGTVARVGRVGAKNLRGFASDFARGAADLALTAAGLGAPPLEPYTRSVEVSAPPVTSNGARALVSLSEHALVETPIEGITSADETSFRSIASREGWVSRVAWNPGAPANLATFAVCPVITPVSTTVGTTPTATAYLYSPAGYISLPFSYWRGTVRFRIEVRANKFCTGTLRVRYLPRTYASPSFRMEASDVLSHSLDITTGNELVIDCPFSADRPWLRVPFTTTPDTSRTFSNGMIVIDYSEGLKSNGTAVDINIYMSCPDLELSGLGGAGNFHNLTYNVSTTPAADPTYQSWDNDQFKDVRDAIKLPRWGWSLSSTHGLTTKYNSLVVADGLFINPLPTAQAMPAGWQTYYNPFKHFCGLYLARSGSIRYTMLYNREGSGSYASDPIDGVRYTAGKRPATASYALNSAGSATSVFSGLVSSFALPGSLAMMVSPQATVTFDSPQSSASNWVPARGVASYVNAFWTDFGEPIQHAIFSTGDDTNVITLNAFLSAGDDASLSYFLCVPFLVRGSNLA